MPPEATRKPQRQRKMKEITYGIIEKEFIGQVRELTAITGWDTYHTFLSIRSQPGFPDLFCVKLFDEGQGLALALEVKSAKGKLTDHQCYWLSLLTTVPGILAAVIRPADLDALALALIARSPQAVRDAWGLLAKQI